jgi:hypothetical protein
MAFFAAFSVCEAAGKASGEAVTFAAANDAFDSAEPMFVYGLFVLAELALNFFRIIRFVVNG